MPDPNTPALSTTLSQLPAQAIHERFAHRPALFSVVFNALRERILERYPTLEMDLRAVKLASPDPSGGWTFQLLSNVAVNHVLNPQLLDWRPQHDLPFYLTQKIPSRLKTKAPPYVIDMQVIAQIIDALPSTIHIYFQQALADYWSEIDAQGDSRWQWLGDFLNGQITAAAAARADLTQTQRDMLSLVAAWPERLQRLSRSTPATYAYFIETTLTRDGEPARLLTPDLLLVRDKQVLLCGVAGAIEAFDSIDAFDEAWGTRMQSRFQFDSIRFKRNEPDGNVFEQQAGLILNQQLEDLETLSYQGRSERALERRLEQLTDPSVLFSSVPAASTALLQKVNNHLPEWLKQADARDRFAYHRHLQDMALVLKQNQGRSFNEGIENIHDFSRVALRKQMQIDHAGHDPDDVVLDFAVAAGYPGGAGIIEHVRMSLTALALKNLSGKPKGTLALSSKSGKTLPKWLDEDYLLGSQGLIQRVDIGTAYPQKIKDLLLSDTVDARRRETLFTTELKVRLPMQALEYKVRNQHGVSAQGYRYVKALMGEALTDRIVDDQEIVLRPLALFRKAGAAPDEVNNILIIEPRDTNVGPHLLYRPLYADCLHEYPTRQALLDAIATPGDLQDSVLAWLTDKARPIYDHGGIKEPHIVHFLSGDEFATYDKPAPATLAVNEGAEEWLQAQANCTLLSHLFGSTARALVDLADHDSVSNSESRWAIVMEGAWLLFNTLLLPLVQGPAMLAGWFLVLVSSLEQDLTGLDSDDPTTRELALIDLLLNTAMVLLHAATPSNRSRQPLVETAPEDSALHLASWRRTAGLSHPHDTPVVQHATVALPGEPPAAGHTTLDFSRSIASPKAGAKLLEALLAVNVPWPEALPPPEASGVFKGLYRIDDTWHASVGGLLFQVSIETGFGDVYLVDPKHPDHPGFKLASDGQGHWRLDRGAKLKGGMPKDRFQKWEAEYLSRLKTLATEINRMRSEVNPLYEATTSARNAMASASESMEKQHKQLRQLFELRSKAIEALRETITTRHEQQQSITARSKVQWDIAFDNFNRAFQAELPLTRRLIDKETELAETDRTNAEYREHRDSRARRQFINWGLIYEYLEHEERYVSQSERGESYAELQTHADEQADAGITTAYEEVIKRTKARYEVEKNKTEPAQEIEKMLHEADPILRKKLLDFAPSAKDIGVAAVKQRELLFLSELVLDHSCVSQEPLERRFVKQINNRHLYQSILGHLEMRSSSGYSTAEQMAVLKDVLAHYERMENAINSLAEMNSGFVRDDYRAPFLQQLAEARTSLETQLADLILVDEGFAPAPVPDKPTRAKPPARKVIKTRNQGSIVGDLRPLDPQDPGSFVDIKDPATGQTVATYLEHVNEGVWVEVVPATTPALAPVPEVRSLNTIKKQAETIMAERAGIERRIRDQQKKLQDPTRREYLSPLDWEDMLTQHAKKLETLAEEIQRDHSTDTNAVALNTMYLEEANAVTKLAREVCSEGYKLQLPKATNIAYLWKHGFVDINLVSSRAPTRAGDYLTEYAVREKNKPDVLWYAHFHYPAVDTPAAQHNFGHLKRPQERYLTRRQLIEAARANNRAVVNLDKAVINPPLDQALFLKLEPN
ncbi:dermonecrotic toxin domain-containing protein [Pseudomonas silesiensis]|uniref:dermonecrotic toxin domain-containing protein n=1 Tax=Pseudomonas silesiensis TaxID=1853130 RepID=UPI0030DAC6C3